MASPAAGRARVPCFAITFCRICERSPRFVTQKILDIVWQAGEINQTGLNRLAARPARAGSGLGNLAFAV